MLGEVRGDKGKWYEFRDGTRVGEGWKGKNELWRRMGDEEIGRGRDGVKEWVQRPSKGWGRLEGEVEEVGKGGKDLGTGEGLGMGKMGRRIGWGGGMGSETTVKGWGRIEGIEVEYIGKE